MCVIIKIMSDTPFPPQIIAFILPRRNLRISKSKLTCPRSHNGQTWNWETEFRFPDSYFKTLSSTSWHPVMLLTFMHESILSSRWFLLVCVGFFGWGMTWMVSRALSPASQKQECELRVVFAWSTFWNCETMTGTFQSDSQVCPRTGQ